MIGAVVAAMVMGAGVLATHVAPGIVERVQAFRRQRHRSPHEQAKALPPPSPRVAARLGFGVHSYGPMGTGHPRRPWDTKKRRLLAQRKGT